MPRQETRRDFLERTIVGRILPAVGGAFGVGLWLKSIEKWHSPKEEPSEEDTKVLLPKDIEEERIPLNIAFAWFSLHNEISKSSQSEIIGQEDVSVNEVVKKNGGRILEVQLPILYLTKGGVFNSASIIMDKGAGSAQVAGVAQARFSYPELLRIVREAESDSSNGSVSFYFDRGIETKQSTGHHTKYLNLINLDNLPNGIEETNYTLALSGTMWGEESRRTEEGRSVVNKPRLSSFYITVGFRKYPRDITSSV